MHGVRNPFRIRLDWNCVLLVWLKIVVQHKLVHNIRVDSKFLYRNNTIMDVNFRTERDQGRFYIFFEQNQ